MKNNSNSRAFRTIAYAITRAIHIGSKKISSSAITVMLMGGVYVVHTVIDEGSISAAYHVILSSKSERAKALVKENENKAQAAIASIKDVDSFTQDTLVDLLKDAQGAIRVRVGIIHRDRATIAGRELLRYDITHGASILGRAVGPMGSNLPLSDWSPYLDAFLNNQCVMVRASAWTDPALVEKINAMGIVGILACPIREPSGVLFGGLFLHWDDPTTIPNDLDSLTARMHEAAIRIGTAYSLRIKAQ